MYALYFVSADGEECILSKQEIDSCTNAQPYNGKKHDIRSV